MPYILLLFGENPKFILYLHSRYWKPNFLSNHKNYCRKKMKYKHSYWRLQCLVYIHLIWYNFHHKEIWRGELKREVMSLAVYCIFWLNFFSYLLMLVFDQLYLCWPLVCVFVLQVFSLGLQRYEFVDYQQKTNLALSHIMFKGWDPSWETMPYPATTGQYALYKTQDFFDHLNFAMTNVSFILSGVTYVNID